MYSKEEQRKAYKLAKELLTSELSVASMEQLRNNLIFHEWKYYVQNDPLLSDFEYDQLFKKLQKLESENPSLITKDSPTQRVAVDLSPDSDPVAHMIPMLSLGNSYNAEDLEEFNNQIIKLINAPEDTQIEYVVEPKFDGGSIALVYEDDFLTRAATRGNGTKGEEMTANAKAMPSIPLKAKFSEHGFSKVELRGEALIRKDNFKKINEQRADAGLSLFANPRNAATGGLRMKDANETRKRGLEAFIFQFGFALDANGDPAMNKLTKHFDSIRLLGELGFKIPNEQMKLCNNIQEVIDFCKMWEAKRDEYEYEIDGMVIKVNDLKLQEKCGSTAHHPRWAIAYKFQAKQATSKLINVEYQVGKIGSITPVAKVEPVQVAGVTVSSISLHNAEFIASKDLRIGDTVVIERAGDVIPYIVKSLEDLRDGSEEPIEFPTHCPVNSSEKVALIKEDNEAAWRCPNCSCGLQSLQRIIFHVSKDAMDIDGFGKSYVERFHQLGWIKDISDIYALDYEAISQLEGFGEKSALNLESAINKAKNNPISRLLHSLSIHHLGKKASKLLAQEVNHVLDLKDWDLEKFTEIKDIGPVVAENVMEYFSKEENRQLLQRLESNGVNLFQTEADKPLAVADDAPFKDKTILFTGSLQKMGRKEAQKLAELNGAKNISAVSSNLNILVVGEKAGSKLKKAQALGTVEILSEDQFIKLVNQ